MYHIVTKQNYCFIERSPQSSALETSVTAHCTFVQNYKTYGQIYVKRKGNALAVAGLYKDIFYEQPPTR